jgi:hypothetical protein
MEEESLTQIELALRGALMSAPETDHLSADEIVELAELGRRHPRFEEKMAIIARSPVALSLYMSARETAPAQGLRRVAETWMEGLKKLPLWFDAVVSDLQKAPSLAYRSTSAAAHVNLQLASPDPVNQSVFPDAMEWTPAGDPASVLVDVAEVDSGDGRRVLDVTITPAGDAWSLDEEAGYRFRVLSEEEADKARWAFDNAEEAPVASGLALCCVGLFAEAEKLLSRWPADEELEAYASIIRRACQARRADARRLYL